MKLDNKKILKEFLRLKWQETKWLWLVVFPLLTFYFFVALPLADVFVHWDEPELWILDEYESNDYVMAILFTLLAGCLLGLGHIFHEWIKSNWEKATYNIYPKLRPKKKKKKVIETI